MKKNGKLIIIGGNEDKGIETSEREQLEFIEKSILARVVKESGGSEAKIVIIPTASNIPYDVISSYLDAFEKLDCKNVEAADIRTRKDSEDKKNIKLIEEADCVMISGGTQSQISHIIGGTPIHQILLERYENKKGFVIAGTSAGAMCMSEEMIAGGGGKGFFTKGSVSMGEGLGFIPKLIIDSHFIKRGRFGRLAEAVARNSKFIGMGLAENTGIVVSNSNTFEVIGSGMLVIFDPESLTYDNACDLQIGEPMTIANLKTHILAKGMEFSLEKREIRIQDN